MEAITGLASWLAGGGARHDDLIVREVGGQRGVYAARPIATGTVVASVPRVLLITREQVRVSSLGRQLRDANLELSSVHALFAAWLCTARRDPGSPYHPYFDSLPRDFGGFPLHAPAAELALLDGSLTGAMVRELRTDLDADFAALRAKVRLCRALTLEELTWARLCAGSRVFAVTVDGVDTTALVPFGDLLNHSREPHTRWQYDQDAGAFTITALRDYAAGDEVCDSYGSKPNSRLLVQYGFCLDDNPDDEAEILDHRTPRDPAHPSAQQLLAALRKQHADDEAATRSALAAAAAAAHARFPTTIADDDALLADAALPAGVRNFIVARRGEKAVLRAWLDYAAAGSDR